MKRLAAVATLLILVLACLWHYRADLSRAMLNHDNRFLNYSLSQTVLERLPKDAGTQEKIRALLDYTYLVTRAQGKCKTWGEVWWFVSGQAWCDHSSRAFNSLLEPLNIKAYTAYLIPPPPARDSPHSVSYITPEHPGPQKPEPLQKTAMVADTYFGAIWLLKNNRPAAPVEICLGRGLPKPLLNPEDIAKQRTWFCQTPQIAQWNTPLSWRSWPFRQFYGKMFPLLPMAFKRIYLDLALWMAKDGFSQEEYLFYRARAHHLFLELKRARELYELLLKRYPKTSLKPLIMEFLELMPRLEHLGHTPS